MTQVSHFNISGDRPLHYSLPKGYQLEKLSGNQDEKFLPDIPIFDVDRLAYYSESLLRKILKRLGVSIDTNNIDVAEDINVKVGEIPRQRNLVEYLNRLFANGKFLLGKYIPLDQINAPVGERSIYLTQFSESDKGMRIILFRHGKIGYAEYWINGKLDHVQDQDLMIHKKYDASGMLIELRSWTKEPSAAILGDRLLFQYRITEPKPEIKYMTKEDFNCYMINKRNTIVNALIESLPKDLGDEIADYTIDSLNGIRYYE